MSEMVERVARALCVADGKNPDGDRRFRGPIMLDVALKPGEEQWWRVYVKQARVAIKAMREPAKDMVEAGWPALENAIDSDFSSNADGERFYYYFPISGSQTEIYQAMIDAALKE